MDDPSPTKRKELSPKMEKALEVISKRRKVYLAKLRREKNKSKK